jgi:hypothetical protein
MNTSKFKRSFCTELEEIFNESALLLILYELQSPLKILDINIVNTMFTLDDYILYPAKDLFPRSWIKNSDNQFSKLVYTIDICNANIIFFIPVMNINACNALNNELIGDRDNGQCSGCNGKIVYYGCSDLLLTNRCTCTFIQEVCVTTIPFDCLKNSESSAEVVLHNIVNNYIEVCVEGSDVMDLSFYMIDFILKEVKKIYEYEEDEDEDEENEDEDEDEEDEEDEED